MSKNFEINGLNELKRALNDLKPKFKNQVLRSFFRQVATKQVVKPLRSHLPYSKDVLKKIKVSTSRSDTDKTSVYAGLTYDKFWIRFLEKGTKPRYNKKGAYRGQIIARPRIEPYVDSRIDDIIKYTNKEMGKSVEKILAKKLKRMRK